MIETKIFGLYSHVDGECLVFIKADSVDDAFDKYKSVVKDKFDWYDHELDDTFDHIPIGSSHETGWDFYEPVKLSKTNDEMMNEYEYEFIEQDELNLSIHDQLVCGDTIIRVNELAHKFFNGEVKL